MSEVVLAFVEDPGAANGIAPLPPAFAAVGLELRVVAAGSAVEFLAGKIPELITHDGGSAEALLERHRPRVVLVGTSENPKTLGLALVDAARARGLPSAGFVDAAPNAEHRFRGETTDALAHCPDVVLVPDAYTQRAFVELGLPPQRVVPCGHPHHDVVRSLAERLELEGRDAIRARLLPGAPRGATVVVFAAEINGGFDETQFQRSVDYTLHGRGARNARTQIVLEEVIDAVRARLPGAWLVLRLHPKNVATDFEGLDAEVDFVSRGGSPLELVFAADLVCGMTTTLLTEASLLGRPTLSVVPRELEREWLDSARDGATNTVTTRAALHEAIATMERRADGHVREREPHASERTAAVVARLAREGAPENR